MRNSTLLIVCILSMFVTVAAYSAPTDKYPIASGECEQFDKPEFRGTRISFKSSNLQFRDLLYFLMEEFGCHFVLGKGDTHFSLNSDIKDTPWNIALRDMLDPRDLATQLSVSTSNEGESQSLIRIVSREEIAAEKATAIGCRFPSLDSLPLVTHTARLKNLPSCSPGTHCDAASEGIEKMRYVLARRISRRGSVEFAADSQTFSVTDVQINVNVLARMIDELDTEKFYRQGDPEKPWGNLYIWEKK